MHCTGTLFEIMLASDAVKMAYGAYQLSYDAEELRKFIFHLRTHHKSVKPGHDYRQASATADTYVVPEKHFHIECMVNNITAQRSPFASPMLYVHPVPNDAPIAYTSNEEALLRVTNTQQATYTSLKTCKKHSKQEKAYNMLEAGITVFHEQYGESAIPFDYTVVDDGFSKTVPGQSVMGRIKLQCTQGLPENAFLVQRVLTSGILNLDFSGSQMSQ